ncbi:MAG: cytochrome c oxidase subunit 3, partial [Pirellula sp.]
HGDAAHGDAAHGDAAHGDAAHGDAAHGDAAHGDAAKSDHSHGAGQDAGHAEHAVKTVSLIKPEETYSHPVAITRNQAETPLPDVNQKGMAGLFFSIYYCMTGVHAIHIIGGMVVITWLIVKSAREEFHSQYFGPVDNVGLYWHLVDFIWIYLFPLLYLIT